MTEREPSTTSMVTRSVADADMLVKVVAPVARRRPAGIAGAT